MLYDPEESRKAGLSQFRILHFGAHIMCTESYGGGSPSGSGPKIGESGWQHMYFKGFGVDVVKQQ